MWEDWTNTQNYENFKANVKAYGMSKRQYMRKQRLATKYGQKVWSW